MIEEIKEISNFIVVRSRSRPKTKAIIYKNKKSQYFWSQNCLSFSLDSKNFIFTPLADLISCLNSNDLGLKDGLNKVENGVHIDETDNEFFLNFGEKIKLKYIYKDSKLTDLYSSFMKDNLLPVFKGFDSSVNPHFLSCFCIFQPDNIQAEAKLPKIDDLLSEKISEFNIFDEIMMKTNSFVLSFDKLFRGISHFCSITQKSSVYDGVYRLDFRGYPEIEGSPVFLKAKDKKEAKELIGMILPGLFHNGNYREYVTLFIEVRSLIQKIFGELVNLTQRKESIGDRLKTFLTYFQRKTFTAKDFWMGRTCKIYVFDQKEFHSMSGTGILLNKNLVMTNKHLIPENKLYGSITIKGKKYEIKRAIRTHGSLDVGFLTLKKPVKNIPRIPDDWSLSDIICPSYERNMDTVTLGFPVDGSSSQNPEISVSKGELLSYWNYQNERRKLKPQLKKLLVNEPVFLLISNIVMSGNSGGPLLDEKGRLMGVIFCNMRINKHTVINEMALAVNVGLFRKLVYKFVMNHKRGKWYAKEVKKTKVFSFRDQLLDDASEFYMPVEFLNKL